MYPVLFSAGATTWSSFGIGVLSDAISCEVEENRNGPYELEMTYPVTGVHFADIALRCLILAKPNYTDNPQPFRVYNISKPLNGIVTVNAQHISYDLSGYVDAPFQAANAPLALAKLTDSTVVYPYPCPFTFTTNIIGTAVMKVNHPESVRALMGGVEGSVIDNYGGEWHFDGYTCELKSARGADRGVVIQYGKNLTDLRQEENNASVYTGVYPYYYNKDNDILVTLTEKVLTASGTFSYSKILPLDLSYDFEEAPTESQLRTKAQAYIDNNNIGVPKVNLTISFMEADSAAYRVDLCDTVAVRFDAMGVTASAKCIRTKWDVLRGRYIEAELGSAKNSLAGTIANSSEIARVIDERTVQFQSVAAGIISKVTGNQGGYIVLHDTNNDGEPDEILIMDDDDITQALNIIRMNGAGIAFSKTGYNGTYTTAWNINGEFVADFIASGELQTDHVTILGDTQFYWDSSNITIVDPNNTNRVIRFGKYDGTHYGLAFSDDGGTTWASCFNFDGIKFVDSDPSNQGYAEMSNDAFKINNNAGVTIARLGIGTVNMDDGTIGQAAYYQLGTRVTGGSSGEYSFAGGRFCNPSGPYCCCVGYNNSTPGNSSVGLGRANTAAGSTSIAIGKSNTANGDYSIAIGNSCNTGGGTPGYSDYVGGIAIGSENTATQRRSVALGSYLSVDGIGSSYECGIAVGISSRVRGTGIVIGSHNYAENDTPTSLDVGLAIGWYNYAKDYRAMAIGEENVSSAEYACAIGLGLNATNANQFVCGKYNTTSSWKFVVGNGTDDNNRSNAMRISNAGNMWIAGTLTQGSDARLKDVVGDPPDLSGIHAVRFKWNNKKNQHDNLEHIGYLAQDVENVAPYLVEENEDDGYKSLNYLEFLCAKIDNLERTVERLTARVAELEEAS